MQQKPCNANPIPVIGLYSYLSIMLFPKKNSFHINVKRAKCTLIKRILVKKYHDDLGFKDVFVELEYEFLFWPFEKLIAEL